MKKRSLLIWTIAVILALVTLFTGAALADGNIAYVSKDGSDTTGDGSLTKPYASLSKAYSALSSGGTIALLSDITMSNDTRLICNNTNTYLLTSAHADGMLVENAAGDYTDVRTVHRGDTTYSLMYIESGTFTAKQIIFDGGNKVFTFSTDNVSGNNTGGHILHIPGSASIASFTLSTNAIFRNNRNTGANSTGALGRAWSGGVVLGSGTGTSADNPQLILEKNAQISGCVAPRQGGAITAYTGTLYIKDDASIHHNCIEFRSTYTQDYYGGGAIIVYRTSKMYLSGNVEIRDNYVDLGGCDRSWVVSGCKANAVQVSISGRIYVSGNVRIFDNVVKNCQNAFGLEDNEQANAFDATSSGGAFMVEAAMGTNAKIGVRANTDVVANGSGYNVTSSDAEAFFDDTGKRTVIKAVGANQLVFTDAITNAKLALAGDAAWKEFTATLTPMVTGLTQNDITVFVNGVKQTTGYTVNITATGFTVTFDESITGKKFAASVSKNGYKVTDKGDGTGTTVVTIGQPCAYVSATGSDTAGDGSLAKPYASLSKAYSALSSGGTIALLSDITMSNDTRLICNNTNTYLLTSAHADGTLVDNDAGDYTDVRTVHRGSTGYSMMLVTSGTFTAKQIIFDGGNKVFTFSTDNVSGNNTGGHILHIPDSASIASFTLSTNAIFRNNRNTGANSTGALGRAWSGGVVLGSGTGTSADNPQLILEKNAQISGCVAPRHGGAITGYSGVLYMKDNASIHHNCIEFRSNYTGDYFGGGAILVYGTNVHLSGNAEICDNYVDMGGCSSSKAVSNAKANAVQISVKADVCVSENVRIFDNTVKNCQNAFGLQDNEQANVLDAVGGSFLVEGAMGANAKIGVRSNSDVVANGSGYNVTSNDAEAFFDDTGKRTVIKAVGANRLVFSASITNVKLALAGDAAWKIFTGTLTPMVEELTQNDITIFVDGVKQTSGYTLKITATGFTVTFDESITGKKFAASVSKNGYKVTDKGDGTGTTVVTIAETPTPALNEPANITATGFTASWGAVSGAESYRLDIATDAEFKNLVTGYNDLTVAGTSANVTGLNKGTTYYFRVRAYSTSGGTSPSSAAKSATTLSDATVTTAPAANTLTYNGFAQQLVTAGAAANGSMRYGIGENATTPPASWETSPVSGKEAGTYYVWYKAATVNADKGCSDSTPVCVTVNLDKKTLTIESADISYRSEGGVCTATVENIGFGGLVGSEELVYGTDYTAEAVLDDKDYDKATKVTVTITFLNTATAANYKVSGSKDLPKESSPLVKPVITPMTAKVYVGEKATFTLTTESVKLLKDLAGEGNKLTYQWYIDRNTGSFVKLDGETSTSYTTAETTLENDGYRYRCEVTDAHKRTVVSDAATLRVANPPVPVTGDENLPLMWLGLMLTGLCGIVLLKRRGTR